eukprot:scaffold50320_cov14-Tisochrysis_lutea.AAC.1
MKKGLRKYHTCQKEGIRVTDYGFPTLLLEKSRRQRKPSLHESRKRRHIGSRMHKSTECAPLHHKAGTKGARGDLEDSGGDLDGSILLQIMAVRSLVVFDCKPCGNKFMGVIYRTSLDFICKLVSL